MGMETAALAIKLKLELNPMPTRSEPNRTEPTDPNRSDAIRNRVQIKSSHLCWMKIKCWRTKAGDEPQWWQQHKRHKKRQPQRQHPSQITEKNNCYEIFYQIINIHDQIWEKIKLFIPKTYKSINNDLQNLIVHFSIYTLIEKKL